MDRQRQNYIWREYKHRIIGTLAGVLFALITMSQGFWVAVGFYLLIFIGYLIGAYMDGQFTWGDLRYFFKRYFR